MSRPLALPRLFPLLLLGAALPAFGAGAEEAAPSVQPAAESSTDWPQWRGPTRDGRVAGPAWPDRLSEENCRRLWQTEELGNSYSGPIVAGDRVFTTASVDRKYEVVTAFDRATGRQLWQTKWEGVMTVPFFAWQNGSWIRATPACDGERLLVAGMRDLLVCLNAADGTELWRFDFMKELGSELPAFGFVSSPLLHGDAVFVQAGGHVAKLDKRTGELLWKSLGDGGGMYGSAFSSPAIGAPGGREQLLVQTRSKLAGLELAEGRVLWEQEVPAFRGMNILSPTLLGDALFTSTYGGKSFLYEVSFDTERTDSAAVHTKWENKLQGYMSTPVVIDGHAYLHLKNQRFACVNLADGRQAWVTEPFGKYWSLVAQGNRILALDERGELLLVEADPSEFRLIDRLTLSDEPTWAHLAVSGDLLFVRDLKRLTAYRWREGTGE